MQRYASRKAIALLTSIMVLVSSLVPWAVPVNQASAAVVEGTSNAVVNNVYSEMLVKAKGYYDITKAKVLSNYLDTLAFRNAWGGDFTGYTLPPEFASDYINNQAGGYGDRILGLLAVGGNPYETSTRQNLVKDLVQYQMPSGSFNTSNLAVHSWAVIGLNEASAAEYYNKSLPAPAKLYDKTAAINHIISKQNAANGSIGGTLSSTATALIALAGAKEIDGVDAAIQKAVAYVKTQQKATGDFTGGFGTSLSDTANAAMALAAVGINVNSNEWTLSGLNPFDVFKKYQLAEGGFANTTAQLNSNTVNPTATQYAIIALASVVTGQTVWDQITFSAPALILGWAISVIGEATQMRLVEEALFIRRHR